MRVPLPYVIRKADQKTLDQIHDEIETAKSQAIEDEGDYVLGNKYNPGGNEIVRQISTMATPGLDAGILFQ